MQRKGDIISTISNSKENFREDKSHTNTNDRKNRGLEELNPPQLGKPNKSTGKEKKKT